jgi:tetratricopeptide (TPR) repeat protein
MSFENRVRGVWPSGLLRLIFVLLLVLLALPSLACGPGFPNRLLSNGDDVLLEIPAASFYAELDRLLVLTGSGGRHEWERNEQDIHVWLKAHDTIALQGKSDDVKARYEAVHNVVDEYGAAVLLWARRIGQESVGALPVAPVAEVLKGDPVLSEAGPENATYMTGAIALREGRAGDARTIWQGLRPKEGQEPGPTGRLAAFMLGMACMADGRHDEAVSAFRTVRTTAAADRIDALEVLSYGWEARAELEMNHYEKAVALYLKQYEEGEPGAAISLRVVAGMVSTLSEGELKHVLQDRTTRCLVTAYILAYGGRNYLESHKDLAEALLSVSAAGGMVLDEADRLAWLAYRSGRFDAAERWLKAADTNAAIGSLVRSKLLLRAGKLDEAATEMWRLSRRLPEPAGLRNRFGDGWGDDSRWDLSRESLPERVRGELGVLRVARKEFEPGLDMLLRGGYWHDAAYVAERVLTTPELKAYVDREWPASDDESGLSAFLADNYSFPMMTRASGIRYLLARRLVRDGRLDDASSYMPGCLRRELKKLVEDQELAEKSNDKRVRVAAYWRVACIIRYRGMELMGTELDPDAAVYRGEFEVSYYWDGESGDLTMFEGRVADLSGKVAPATSDEISRAKASLPKPNLRFHYRYMAADYAWKAAELVPDDDVTGARILCMAGMWLEKRDPSAADRYYKELVRRFGRTELGAAADKLRWFPKVEIKEAVLLDAALKGEGAAMQLPVEKTRAAKPIDLSR